MNKSILETFGYKFIKNWVIVLFVLILIPFFICLGLMSGVLK